MADRVIDPVADPELDALVDKADLDGLVRAVDGLSSRRDWERLLALRTRCRHATRTGRQLWPIASLIEYRLALDAPGDWVAHVLTPDAGHFAFGPLTEVAASTHTWAELAPHLEPRAVITAFVAHERVVRGEDLRGDARVDERVLEPPLVLAPWEPAYPVATYRHDAIELPAPPLPVAVPASASAPAEPGAVVDDADAISALRSLVEPWSADSNGRVEAVAVEGDAAAAVACLGVASPRFAPLGVADAMAWLAWAGASGGAYGRRRGMATGRFGAWWVVAALAGLGDDWPVPPDELGEAASELRWYWWDAGEPATGWELRLAVDDPVDGLAWAITATDHA